MAARSSATVSNSPRTPGRSCGCTPTISPATTTSPTCGGEPAPLCGVWARQVADLPDALRLSEPVGGIGFAYEGRLISNDIIRFQHVIGTLHRQGVLERLAGQPHPFTLEIGSGYGGLAYHLHRIVGRGTRVLLDLPETLLFAANYLTLPRPDARMYLY